MRSRFSAFARGDAAYLLASWHPSTRPRTLEVDADVTWRRLQIVDTVAGGVDDADGVVEFRASYRDAGGAGLLHERSRFIREAGRWLYLDGDVAAHPAARRGRRAPHTPPLEEAAKRPSRNQPADEQRFLACLQRTVDHPLEVCRLLALPLHRIPLVE